MHGKGTFFDPRLERRGEVPDRGARRLRNVRNDPDLITPKLAGAALLPAGDPGADAAGRAASTRRGGSAARRCSTARPTARRCHVPPLFTEPGWNHAHAGGDRHRRLPGQPLARRAATARRRSRACYARRRAASTTTAASRRSTSCGTSPRGRRADAARLGRTADSHAALPPRRGGPSFFQKRVPERAGVARDDDRLDAQRDDLPRAGARGHGYTSSGP